MSIRKSLHFSSLALALAGGTCLVAQVNTGSMNGRVTDSSGNPVPGAKLVFESSALFSPRVVAADAKGEYRALLLPVGNYTIKLSANGYFAKQASNVRVGLGSALTLDFSMKALTDKSATVEVVATAASVAKTADKVQTNFSADDLMQLPIARSWDGALTMASGIDPGNNQSIRGSSGGGWGQQISYNINGIEVKSDLGNSQYYDLPGATTLFQPLADSIEDIQIVKSALNARYGRVTGGMVNVSTKSGSNTFEGAVRWNLHRDSWASNITGGLSAGDRQIAAKYEEGRSEQLNHVMDITVGGPIIKDRLWFFLAAEFTPQTSATGTVGADGTGQQRIYDPAKLANHEDYSESWTNYNINGQPTHASDIWKYPEWTYGAYDNVDRQLLGETPYPEYYDSLDLKKTDWNKVISNSTKTSHYEGKLTFQATPSNILSLTMLYQKESHAGQTSERKGSGSADLMQYIGDQVTKTQAYSLTWDAQITSRMTLETKLASTERKYYDVSGPTDYPVFVQASFSGGRYVDPQGSYHMLGVNGNATMWHSEATLRSSSSITPAIVGNRSAYANLRTYVDLAGEHEIDLGGEYFQTMHQYGRERSESYGVFVGGWIHDYRKGWLDKDSFLFPTMYTQNIDPRTGRLNAVYPTTNSGGMYGGMYLYNSWGPGAYIEVYNAGVGKSWDNSTGLWINDTWTINPQWNVMVGLRGNHYVLKDTTGAVLEDTKIVEPRFQLKFNPDGNSRHIFSFTAAKLASKYSDDMASCFLTQSWNDRNVYYWKGIGDQPALDDTAATATDINPANVGSYGLRWVNYDQLIDQNNYSKEPCTVVAQSQLRKVDDLKVPWCAEFTVGYTRNFEKGSVSINFIDRTYHDDWMVNLNGGVVTGVYDSRYATTSDLSKYMTMVRGGGESAYRRWQLNQPYYNSGLTRDYQSVEINLRRKLTDRLRLDADYTWSVQHGRSNDEYYAYRDNKLAYTEAVASGGANFIPTTTAPEDRWQQPWNGPTSENDWAPSGILSRTQVLHIALTYVCPFKDGNASASIFSYYGMAGVKSLNGWDSQNLKINSYPYASGQTGHVTNYDGVTVDTYSDPGMNRFYGGYGQFTDGSDPYVVNARLQAEVALGRGVKLTTYLTINNLFNRILRGDVKNWGGHTNTDAVRTLPLYSDDGSGQAWGYSGDRSISASAGRSYGDFTIGIKF